MKVDRASPSRDRVASEWGLVPHPGIGPRLQQGETMKHAIVLAAALLVAAAPAVAQSAFDGTWKVDTGSAQFGGKPIERLLKDGTFSCTSCVTPWSVAADGAFHPVKGQPYTDDVAVTVVDPATIRMAYRKAGKVDGEETFTVSPDGNTLTLAGRETETASGTPVTYETRQARVGPAPAGAHAVSGSWRAMPGGTVSDSGITVTMTTQGDALTMSYPTGETVTARFGGPGVPVSGDKGNSTVQLVRTGANSLTSTTSRDGKVVSIATITVAPDGRTLTYAQENKQSGSTARYTAVKQ